MRDEIRYFFRRTSAIQVAVGVMVGFMIYEICYALMAGIVVPVLEALTFRGDSNTYVLIYSWRLSVNGNYVPFGPAIGSLFAVMLVSCIAYLLFIRPSNRANVDATRVCPECMSEIPWEAKRCRYCSSELQPEEQATQ